MEKELYLFLERIACLQEMLMVVKWRISLMPRINKVDYGMGVTRILNSDCVFLAIGLEVDYFKVHEKDFLSMGATITFEFHANKIVLLREIVYTNCDTRNEKLFDTEDTFQSLKDLLSVYEKIIAEYNTILLELVQSTVERHNKNQ